MHQELHNNSTTVPSADAERRCTRFSWWFFFRGGGVDHLPPFKDNVTVAEDFHCCTQLCRRRARKCAVAAQSSDNCGNSAHFSLFSSLPPGLPCFPLLLTSPPPPACSEAVIASNGFLLQLPTLSLICHPCHRQLEMWRFKIDRGKTIPPDQCPHNIHLHCIIRSPVVWLWRWWSRYHCPSSAPPTTHVSRKTFLTAIILHLHSSHHQRYYSCQ